MSLTYMTFRDFMSRYVVIIKGIDGMSLLYTCNTTKLCEVMFCNHDETLQNSSLC